MKIGVRTILRAVWAMARGRSVVVNAEVFGGELVTHGKAVVANVMIKGSPEAAFRMQA